MSITAYCKFKTIPLQDATKYCEIEEVNGDFWLKTPNGGTLLTNSKSMDDHFSQLTGYLGGASDDRWNIAEQLIGKDNIMTEDEWMDMIYDHSLAEGTIWEFPSEEEIEAYKKEHPEMFETPRELNDISEEDELNFDNL